MAKSAVEKLNEEIIACNRCPRLRKHCLEIAKEKRKSYLEWTYWGKPVANFGDPKARVLILGLAPAAHGANRTGRMFTGDRSGDWLYRSMHKTGFANQAEATSIEDGLKLKDCVITATAHCAPPDNKPTLDEVAKCRPFLLKTFEVYPIQVIIALGGIAWKAALIELKANGWLNSKGALPKFYHGADVELAGGRVLIGSYHPSQQNTFTGRLTEPMLDQIFKAAAKRITSK